MNRLLLLNTYYYRRGGSDVVFMDQESTFSDLQWEVAVMAMHHPRNEESDWQSYFVSELEFGHSYSVSEKIGMAAKVVYSLEARKQLSRLLDVFPASIAHAHCIYHHLSPSVLVELKARNIPAVLTAHDLKLACPNYKMVNSTGICERCRTGSLVNVVRYRCVRDSLAASTLVALETAVHRKMDIYRKNLDAIIAPSHFMKAKLTEWGYDPGRIEYIPNYVDSSSFRPDFSPGKYLLYFGRLQRDKGLEVLIRASHKLGMALIVVGTGPDEAYFKRVAEGMSHARFVGYQSGESLWSYVRNSRLVVLPSEIYENAPLSVLEAYAHGKPVVGARIGGIPELIEEGSTGFLFDSGSVESLCETLEKTRSLSDAQIEGMGKNARAHVAENFSASRHMSGLLSLYSDLGVTV